MLDFTFNPALGLSQSKSQNHNTMKALFSLLLVVLAFAVACTSAQAQKVATNPGAVPEESTDADTGTGAADLNSNDFYVAGWEYGFQDCQITCAEYIEPEWDEIDANAQSQPQWDAAAARRWRKRQGGAGTGEAGQQYSELLDEVVAVPNSEVWLYWQGYSDGYTYCSYGCQQFFSEDQTIEYERQDSEDQNQENMILQ